MKNKNKTQSLKTHAKLLKIQNINKFNLTSLNKQKAFLL